MVLYVAIAGGWVLRVLTRSIGRLCPMLGSFIAIYVPTLITFGLTAPSLRYSWCVHGPAAIFHHGPEGQGDGAVLFLQAEPPPVGWKSTPLTTLTGPSPEYWTAPSLSTRAGQEVATVTTWSLTATMLIRLTTTAARRAIPPEARAVTMTLHNQGYIGRTSSTAWAWASPT